MTIEIKLYKLQKKMNPEWGKTKLEHESFIMSTDLTKVHNFIYEKYGIRLDNNVYKRWYDYERCEMEWILTELEYESV